MAAVSYEAPEHLPDLPALAAAVGRLVAIADEAARADAVSTVFRLLHGVLSAPDDERKRRVRKANPAFHQKLGRHAAGVELLGAVGFEECDDTDAADAEQRSAYVKCYSCSCAWNYKTNQTCYWCSKALAPWTDSPPPVQGAWAARATAAAQAESNCTQQPSPEGGWEPWSSWPKSRRRRGNGNGKNQEDDWWANKNDTPKARSAEDILAELQAIAPHIDKAAIDGIKSQIPPPQPQKPADLNDIYSRAQATERRCKNNLESDEPPAPAAGATSDGSFAAQPVPAINKDPDLEDKAQKMLSQMRKPTATAAAGAQQPL
ncbi:unnamed protein product [Prorocentrum cordatum]|uniref:PUB domain-containing protein n=1 Tax=Prorocentrum cordatum TaxID=2364126 RepID=A0ABN9R4N2_9DINO|nr:unnamed protein product [Polarella glacialis]